MLLEIPVFDIDGALIAAKAGAHRIELCASQADGGITPSQGMILKTKELLSIPFFVMIRPRGGNFVYTTEEISIMLSDIEFCKTNGIKGIVTGVLRNDGTVDKTANKSLINAAGNMQLTFHRAIDRALDPLQALEDIIDCGFHRILTSGQKETAPEGAELIAELNKQAAGRIIIMPGSGVNETNIAKLHQKSNCQEYHSSAKIKMNQSFAKPLPSDSNQTWTVSEVKIKKMLDVLKSC